LRILLLALLLSGLAWAGPTGDLVGVVHSTVPSARSLHGYEYIYGAEVVLEGTDLKTKTNDVGIFEFRKLEPGTYKVLVRCDGFKDAREEIEVISLPIPCSLRVVMEPR
jgi:hypothetical protein